MSLKDHEVGNRLLRQNTLLWLIRHQGLRLPRSCGLVVLLLSLASCTHMNVEDCGGKVLGVREARIRSSQWRMLLADEPAAAARFVPYAQMSALAYAEDQDCGKEPKIGLEDRASFEQQLSVADVSGSSWVPVPEVAWAGACEDDVGLFYRVWKKEAGNAMEVVIAFRGTWGGRDWLYGNFHWLTRFLPMDDQYKRARDYSNRIIAHFQNLKNSRPELNIRFVITGHSLGGGLAQHVLYSFPTIVDQAIVFDPSMVTGYLEQPVRNQVSACECDQAGLNNEARIYRVYDTREILSYFRVFHKIFFNPERHIQEVRFENNESHSIRELAIYLARQAKRKNPSDYLKPWYSGIGTVRDTEELCTAAFERAQRESCGKKVSVGDTDRCPQ